MLCDAALGAAALGDIGRLFPDTPEWRDAASIDLLARAFEQVAAAGWQLVNADCMVVLQAPRIAPHVDEMRARVADRDAHARPTASRSAARRPTASVFPGRGEGAAAQAVVLLERSAQS